MEPVVIVGGGVAGLACGVALADRGIPSVVLEREPECGGRAASVAHRATGDRIDLGPHVLLSAYPEFLGLLERLGTARHVHWQEDPMLVVGTKAGRFAFSHAPLPPPLSLAPSILRFPEFTWRDHFSNVNPLRDALGMSGERFRHLDRLTGLDTLRRMEVTGPVIERVWRFAAMALLNTPLERVSAAALFRVVGALLRERRMHFGFPSIPLADLFVPGATRVIEAAGGQVRRGWEVAGIDRHRDRWRLWGHHGSRLEAPIVVKALPPFGPEIQPAPYVSTYLWLDRPVGRDAAWSLLPKPGRRHYDFYDLSRLRDGWAGRPSVIACNAINPGSFTEADDGDVVKVALHELASFAPEARDAKVLHAAIHRIPMAVPCAIPGFEASRPANRTAEPGLYVAGDWTDTGLPCCMESAAKSGRLAAEAIVADLAARPAAPNAPERAERARLAA